MKLPDPKVGSVIRYSYLWADEAASGAKEGRKDRPSLVLALAVQVAAGETEVLALAITHSRPRAKSDAIALSPAICAALGLDEEAAWVVTTEANAFVWPGPDIRAVPGRKPSTPIYGQMPRPVLVQAARSYLANRSRQRRVVKR